MAQDLERLAQRARTLGSIRGIVRTMKTMAAINATPYEQAATAIEAYQATVRHGFTAFAFRMGSQALPAATAPRQQVLVAFGSDHGFCGNYNELVAHSLRQWLDAGTHAPARRLVLCIGARLATALQERGLPPDQVLMPPASAEGIARVAAGIVTRLEQAGRGEPLAALGVTLAYTRRAEHGARLPLVRTLLPLAPGLLQAPRRWPSRALPDFAMAPQALLAALVRNHLFASLFRAAAEAIATENAARLALMQQAEQSVDERLDELRRQMSTHRQDEITNELMDIVIGHVGDHAFATSPDAGEGGS